MMTGPQGTQLPCAPRTLWPISFLVDCVTSCCPQLLRTGLGSTVLRSCFLARGVRAGPAFVTLPPSAFQFAGVRRIMRRFSEKYGPGTELDRAGAEWKWILRMKPGNTTVALIGRLQLGLDGRDGARTSGVSSHLGLAWWSPLLALCSGLWV